MPKPCSSGRSGSSSSQRQGQARQPVTRRAASPFQPAGVLVLHVLLGGTAGVLRTCMYDIMAWYCWYCRAASAAAAAAAASYAALPPGPLGPPGPPRPMPAGSRQQVYKQAGSNTGRQWMLSRQGRSNEIHPAGANKLLQAASGRAKRYATHPHGAGARCTRRTAAPQRQGGGGGRAGGLGPSWDARSSLGGP